MRRKLQQESMMITGVPVTKKHTLEDLFRPPIDMTYKGTFQSNKWLLVNLQNVQEFACQSDSIVDASEEAQLEAAIKASLAQQSKQQQPTPTSSSTTVPIESPSACISVNSDSECDSDDLETFTGSEDESNQGKGFGQDGYELVVNFPRRTISSLDPMTTVKDAELHPQETIFVQAR
nr:hypothetical protein BaRGS_005995 [Batillaria attramentaria]